MKTRHEEKIINSMTIRYRMRVNEANETNRQWNERLKSNNDKRVGRDRRKPFTLSGRGSEFN